MTDTKSMKTRSLLTTSLTLAALFLAAVPGVAQPKPAETDPSQLAIQKAVLEVNAKMIQAANSLNVEAFFDYILDSDQCVIIQNGTVFKTRQEALQAVKMGFKGVEKLNRQFEDPQVTVISPEVALLASEGSLSATLTDGRVINARFAVSLLFVRKAGQWKLLHGHYSAPLRGQ